MLYRTPQPLAPHLPLSIIRSSELFLFVKECAVAAVSMTLDAIGIRKGAFNAVKCGSVERVDNNEKMDRVVGKTRKPD
jgi:hypothetical protein